jgi:multidrug efflux pump subunit AcrA (membrane-fusion protein)
MKKLLLLTVLLSAVACSEERESTTPTIGPITESVYASGTVKALAQYTVYPVVNGIVTHVLVLEGDTVKAGDALFRIDDRSSEIGERSARLNIELLEQNASAGSPILAQLKANLSAARSKLINDSSLYVKQQRLWEQNIGSENELRQRELAYTTSRDNLLAAEKAYVETRVRLRNQLSQARNELALSKVAQDDRTVRSLIEGRVYDVLIERGELATPQSRLAVVGRHDAFILELEVDEFDVTKVREGQTAIITMDAHKGKVLQATIQRIDPIMDERSRTFTVEAMFIDPPSPLYPNLTAEGNIIVAKEERAMTIPSSYLMDGDFVVTEAEKPVAVEVGLRDMQKVQIISGLDSNSVIYLPG